jgi:hypothetical protein
MEFYSGDIEMLTSGWNTLYIMVLDYRISDISGVQKVFSIGAYVN